MALLVCLGCSKGGNRYVVQTPEARLLTAPPEIDSSKEEGFSDCVFYFDQVQGDGDHLTLNPIATSKGKKVGFTIQFDAKWNVHSEAVQDVNVVLQTGKVTFQRSGPESDDFVSALATYYGKPAPGKTMNDTIQFNAVCLKGSPGTLGLGPASIKMFIGSEDQSKYGEFFLDIDMTLHMIRLGEKDTEYREPILKALTNPSK
jgi:hypothetical protein